jgi:gliding motility-associated-like protein
VNIEKFISADFSGYAGPYCRNDAPINLNSIAQNPGGIWTGPGVVNGVFTAANGNIGSNNIINYATHSVPTVSLCPDTSTMRISVNAIPNVELVSSTQKGCAPVEVIFNTPSVNGGVGTWNFGDGSPSENNLTVTHLYNQPGTYTVSFNYADDIGCSTQTVLANTIDVYEVPDAAFIFEPQDDITVNNPTVQFTNMSTVLGNNSYEWQIHNLYQLNDINPKVTFPQAGEYRISLTATTVKGCKDEAEQTVSVKNDYGVYVPNSFSPNFDGLNDVFMPVFSPIGLDLKTGYQMEVFDRWGHQLFNTKDFTIGWDGTVQNKGEDPMKQEVYVYKLKYKDSEGKIHTKTGHVSLIK